MMQTLEVHSMVAKVNREWELDGRPDDENDENSF